MGLKAKWKILSVFSAVMGVWTVVPAPASKSCLLGYYAHCSFTPIGTIICLVISGAFLWIGRRREK